jgi:hypothetical protein
VGYIVSGTKIDASVGETFPRLNRQKQQTYITFTRKARIGASPPGRVLTLERINRSEGNHKEVIKNIDLANQKNY